MNASKKWGGGVGKGWLNPATFVILALCDMLLVIFSLFFKFIYKMYDDIIKDDNDDDDDIKVVMAQ